MSFLRHRVSVVLFLFHFSYLFSCTCFDTFFRCVLLYMAICFSFVVCSFFLDALLFCARTSKQWPTYVQPEPWPAIATLVQLYDTTV